EGERGRTKRMLLERHEELRLRRQRRIGRADVRDDADDFYEIGTVEPGSDALADHVAVRERRARQRLVDDGDKRSAVEVSLGKVASLNDRNAERRKVPKNNDNKDRLRR